MTTEDLYRFARVCRVLNVMRPLRFTLHQFSEVFKLRDAAGNPYVLIRDQAVNYWAERYLAAEPQLRPLQPFTSEDIDFKGGRSFGKASLKSNEANGALEINRPLQKRDTSREGSAFALAPKTRAFSAANGSTPAD